MQELWETTDNITRSTNTKRDRAASSARRIRYTKPSTTTTGNIKNPLLSTIRSAPFHTIEPGRRNGNLQRNPRGIKNRPGHGIGSAIPDPRNQYHF